MYIPPFYLLQFCSFVKGIQVNFPLSINKVLYCIALYCIACAGFAYRLCVHVCVQFVFVVCVCVCVVCKGPT